MRIPIIIIAAAAVGAVLLAPDIMVPFLITLMLVVCGAALFITILGTLYGAFVALGTAMFFYSGRKDGR